MRHNIKNVDSRLLTLSQVEIRRPDGKFRAVLEVIQTSANFEHPSIAET